MNEAFLSYVWQFRLYSGSAVLKNGSEFRVESPGILNRDSGPDFTGARIRIGNTLWAGNVEVHIKSSDWYLHRHQDDPAYSTVILHVVYQHDADVMLPDRTILPVLEMRNYIDSLLYTRYLQFVGSANEIACFNILKNAEMQLSPQWLISLGIQRLIRKGEELDYLLSRLNNNWLEVLYVSFCKSFGNKINDDLFEMLALRTPYKLAVKYSENPQYLEALFFGQSGLISPYIGRENDCYTKRLISDYQQMRYQHNLDPMEPHLWRFLRTRPANFPTIRIAQLSTLTGSFLKINPLSVDDINMWMKDAANTTMPEYWQQHIHFNRRGSALPVRTGKESIRKLIINGLLPPLLRYGKIYKNHEIISTLTEMIAGMPPEANRITRKWRIAGINANSALESQGITELFNEYCRNKRCLECRFGHQILSKELV